MKTLIVSNGIIDDINVLEKLVDECEYVICADGGARYFYETDMNPDVILGDFDSLDQKILEDMKKRQIECFKFPSKKDKTDTELAVEYAVEKGAQDITLLGATGTRLDHTIGNIMILRKFLDIDIRIRVIDSHNKVFMVNDSLTLNKEENTFVSIIPITNKVEGVTLKGFKYETDNVNFLSDATQGISNEITDNIAHISIRNGICLVIISKD